ncbi:hypothetical protein SAMN04488020_108108 [Palleronia marisminoris]|uniref:Tripartite ATP-independent periplasmic transporters, DctQ component n=1 Tax=Palleronia marisminoris TaxID=315423 RepID=A0A1Y5T8B2_9RHOB|nr:C4-dicarboxylate ABC transporter permease [Palleronia marisminoris]SFH22652.1 hypothetical protein SAMN04488020_108108 [Palleronia marisminoris]SLN57969.1 Tripartite ATP-independent periplasmic transporters, DctQ component [Palleronia marisminoris]
MIDTIVWIVTNIVMAPWNLVRALTQPGAWLDWSNGESLVRFIYYGGSIEFFFVVFTAFLVFTAVGLWWTGLLWGAVRVLESFANGVGRVAAWAGLLMVLQQIVIVFAQRVFASAQLGFGFGTTFSFDVSWWSEELRLYNALVVVLCCAYTFVQRGHVRVDLLYTPASYRTKKVIDMAGALFFMMPMGVVIWLYGWFFMWRHLVTPKVSASDQLDLMMRKASILRWNVETVSFSPNGFNGYFLFKVLLVIFAAMVLLQAVAVFYRAYLEWREGPAAEGRYLDLDTADAAASGH